MLIPLSMSSVIPNGAKEGTEIGLEYRFYSFELELLL
jgi:hypothetical protein